MAFRVGARAVVVEHCAIWQCWSKMALVTAIHFVAVLVVANAAVSGNGKFAHPFLSSADLLGTGCSKKNPGAMADNV